MSSLYNFLAEIGYKIKFNYVIYKTKKYSYSLLSEKIFCKFLKIMHLFCVNLCFKGWFSTRVKIWKIRDENYFRYFWIRDQRYWLKLKLMEGDSLEGSDDTPVYNPHILPLMEISALKTVFRKIKNWLRNWRKTLEKQEFTHYVFSSISRNIHNNFEITFLW